PLNSDKYLVHLKMYSIARITIISHWQCILETDSLTVHISCGNRCKSDIEAASQMILLAQNCRILRILTKRTAINKERKSRHWQCCCLPTNHIANRGRLNSQL